MGFPVEYAILVGEGLVTTYFFIQYVKSKSSFKRLNDAPQLKVGTEVVDAVREGGGSLPYAVVKGNVVTLSPPLQSFIAPSVTGVVQKVTVREHVVSQSRTGFWVDQTRPINVVVNSVPFAIKSPTGDVKIEVLDALSADELDLEVVADRFDPAPNSIIQSLWQFVTGYRRQGIHTMEEFLKEGTPITVVGEIIGKDDSLTVGPAANGAPFFITTMSIKALLRRMMSDISFYKWLAMGLSSVTFLTFVWFAYKRWREWHTQEQERRRLQESRKERRRRVRTDENLSEDKLCVVCQTNPKEVILLPCGHVCLCEDCSEEIATTCPICKRHIENRNEAYIS